jgi:hypothetical protein
MKSAIGDVSAGVTYAVRDTTIEGIQDSKGRYHRLIINHMAVSAQAGGIDRCPGTKDDLPKRRQRFHRNAPIGEGQTKTTPPHFGNAAG